MFDINGGTWAAVAKQLAKDRAEYLEGLVSAVGVSETDKLRGRIMMIDEIIERYPRALNPGNTPDDK